MVFNWLDHTWHNEGTVPFDNVSFQACGRIKDPNTGRVNVLVVGGSVIPPQKPSPDSPIPASRKVWLWDPTTGNIQFMPDSPAYYFHRMIQYTDYKVIVMCPEAGWFYSFDVEGGWNKVGQINLYLDPVAFLVPRSLFRCNFPIEFQPLNTAMINNV
jgi:hypothetical protein